MYNKVCRISVATPCDVVRLYTVHFNNDNDKRCCSNQLIFFRDKNALAECEKYLEITYAAYLVLSSKGMASNIAISTYKSISTIKRYGKRIVFEKIGLKRISYDVLFHPNAHLPIDPASPLLE